MCSGCVEVEIGMYCVGTLSPVFALDKVDAAGIVQEILYRYDGAVQ